MFCHCCGREKRRGDQVRLLHMEEGISLCTRCRFQLRALADIGSTTVVDVWSSLFQRTLKGR